MTDAFQVAIGNNNAGGLATMVMSPDADGIQYPREIAALNGDVYQDGTPFMELRFPDVMTPADWVATLAQFGLTSTKTALVTVRIPDPNKSSYSNYNARAIRPEYGKDLTHEYCWYRTPRILVKQLVAI